MRKLKKKTQINIPRAFIEVRTADMGSRFAYDNHRKLHVEEEIQFWHSEQEQAPGKRLYVCKE